MGNIVGLDIFGRFFKTAQLCKLVEHGLLPPGFSRKHNKTFSRVLFAHFAKSKLLALLGNVDTHRFSAFFPQPFFKQLPILRHKISRNLFGNFPLHGIILNDEIAAGLTVIGKGIEKEFLPVIELSVGKSEHLKAGFSRNGFKGDNVLIFDF